MSNVMNKRWDEDAVIRHDITAGDVIEIGDLLGIVAGKAVPASDFTYQGGSGGTYVTLLQAQEAFKNVFLGVSQDASRAVDTFTNRDVHVKGVFEFDTASASYAVGDLVGPAGNTTGTTYALHKQKVAAVAGKTAAIGRVERATTTSTKVLVRLFSKVMSGTGGAGTSGDFFLSIPITLAALANGDVVDPITFGFPFEIISETFRVSAPATTGSKAATLTGKIGTTAITGSALALTSANCTPVGHVVDGAALTALNVGTATDAYKVTASAVTAFVEGSGVLLVRVRNLS